MIARIYGVYKITIEDLDPVYFILMGNTKLVDNDLVRKIYDLKGSMINREIECPQCQER